MVVFVAHMGLKIASLYDLVYNDKMEDVTMQKMNCDVNSFSYL